VKRAVTSPGAPAAIGPYSQAVEVGEWVFLSGQLGLDPASGRLVLGGVGAECRRALENLAAVLAEIGLGFDDVVKTTIYLTDLGDFATVNEIYGAGFREPFPARATVGVAALPKGARVEIEAVARRRTS
jgi:2-iminobutanoate/2-iminopropanoate deaminase